MAHLEQLAEPAPDLQCDTLKTDGKGNPATGYVNHVDLKLNKFQSVRLPRATVNFIGVVK